MLFLQKFGNFFQNFHRYSLTNFHQPYILKLSIKSKTLNRKMILCIRLYVYFLLMLKTVLHLNNFLALLILMQKLKFFSEHRFISQIYVEL